MTAKVHSSEPDKRDVDNYNDILGWENDIPLEVHAKPCWTPGEDAESGLPQTLKSFSFQQIQAHTRLCPYTLKTEARAGKIHKDELPTRGAEQAILGL